MGLLSKGIDAAWAALVTLSVIVAIVLSVVGGVLYYKSNKCGDETNEAGTDSTASS